MAPFHIGASFGITSFVHYPSSPLETVLLLLLISGPSSSSFIIMRRRLLPTSYFMIKTQLQKEKQNQPILHIFFYIFIIFFSPLYWLYLGFSMASSQDSYIEFYLSFLNIYMSFVQGLAILKSRHIPVSEII